MYFLDTLNLKHRERSPIWIMRQAGRYLPEYRKVRETTPNFISFCLNPEKACEVTLQPIRRFDFDASIIFSDILLILSMYGIPYTILFLTFYLNNFIRNNKNFLLIILNIVIVFIFAVLNPLLSCIPIGILSSVILLSSGRKEIN